MIRFAHLADCHIGAWRDPKLRLLADQAFTQAVDEILNANVHFTIIAGDLFNTALPGIDHVKHVTRQLQRLKEKQVPVYVIAGSHDYSPTGRTMLDVLEEAGLVLNVFKGEVVDNKLTLNPVQDPTTGTYLTGILDKAKQLDSELYEQVNNDFSTLSGLKIFLFHTTLTELKPKGMSNVESKPVSHMPKGFDYYAGGHVHIVDEVTLPGYRNVVYPGPLFPASFSELETLTHGGLFIVELDETSCVKRRIDIKTKLPLCININCNDMDAQTATEQLELALEQDVQDKIVLVRMHGQLSAGSSADIPFRKLFNGAIERGAYQCLRNTVALQSPQFEEVILTDEQSEDIEATTIAEHTGQIPVGLTKEQEAQFMQELFILLAQQPHEGETKKAFEQRILEEAQQLLK